MKELLESGEFSEIMDIDVDLIQITQEIRDRCADNYCGFYGKNHMCPPAVGGLQEYRKIIRKYKKGLLFSKVYALKNKYDYQRMVESGVEFRNEIQKIRNEIKSKKIDCLFFSAGTCSLCQKCAILTDEPCRFPDDAIPSLEAAGIDVVRLSRDYGMTYNSGDNNVTYFGLLIYNN
ncbi:DUF2284 domain-containing protein [Acetobacterium paludosum]|uniref:DUF2284 domain-containing protein n=1 Tax=Acetobacterium paludosum TaxID=52693 RepID=A0A923HUN6_9FIRM|nr:DUF2284 domain-containing protein [Acetobacterium paludosum]MBC3886914.1 DUF2284 domain-containing protein [Acetobacterium paludosum]